MLVKIAILALLMLVFAQDMRSRSVYWFLFPVLIVLFMMLTIPHAHAWPPVLINIGFLLLQLLLVSAYFSVKQGRWVNITEELLGWGDILFLLSIAFYLSVLNYLFFYLSSLLSVLLFWLIFSPKQDKHIPLAGLQALIFSFFLITAWWIRPVNVTSDDWLLQLIARRTRRKRSHC